MSQGGEDKRRNARIPVDFEVRFTFENREHQGHALNLSGDGMFLRTNTMLLKGDRLEVFFRLPNVSEPFWMKGRVVWGTWVENNPDNSLSGMGVQFVDPLPEQKDSLEKFLQQQLNR